MKATTPLEVSQNNLAGADLEEKAGTSDLIDNQSISGLDQVEHMSQQKPNSVESDSQKDDGEQLASYEGWKALYKGLAPGLILQVTHGAIQFTAYEDVSFFPH